ncbi:hypothetical protein D3C71_2245430 [compost metagenome]
MGVACIHTVTCDLYELRTIVEEVHDLFAAHFIMTAFQNDMTRAHMDQSFTSFFSLLHIANG